MTTSVYNPRVTISSPFPEADLPRLHVWIEASARQVACDQTPQGLDAWLDWQLERMESIQIITWGVYLDGDLSGYLEMMPHFLGVPAPDLEGPHRRLIPALDRIAEGHGIFKREMYGRDKTTTAINLVLQEIFASGIEVMQFSLFSHNRLMIKLHESLGGHFGGRLGEPVTQDGKPVPMELWILTKREWNEANAEWLKEYKAAHTTTVPCSACGEAMTIGNDPAILSYYYDCGMQCGNCSAAIEAEQMSDPAYAS